MRGYLIGVAAGAMGVLGTLLAGFAAVSAAMPDRLSPPAITRSVFLDDKLKFLRDRPGIAPSLIAVGSSITWRQFDGAAFARHVGGSDGVLNGGTAYLQLSQTQFLTDFYLDNLAGVRTVVLMTALPDFRNCTTEPVEVLSPEDGSAYAFDREPAGGFYLKYFAPLRYAKSFVTLPSERRPFVGDRFMDDYGTGPLLVPETEKNGLRYGSIEPDPACAASIVAMARDLSSRGVQLVVVFAPVHPEHRVRFADSHRKLRDLRATFIPQVEANGGRVLVMDADPRFAGADFFDAFHLQWPSVQRLSRLLADTLAGELKSAPPEQSGASPEPVPATPRDDS